MPYIKQIHRLKFLKSLDQTPVPTNVGELNYLLSTVIKSYLGENTNYQKINDILGALEGAKLEFYRRVAIPYEDGKITENGDI